MPEWLIGAVLKTVVRASVPRVRIPIPPPFKKKSQKALFFVIKIIDKIIKTERMGFEPMVEFPLQRLSRSSP